MRGRDFEGTRGQGLPVVAVASAESVVERRPAFLLRLQRTVGNRAVRALLARNPSDDDDPGFSRDPNEAQKIGSAGESEEIGRVRQELAAKGYDTVYSKRDITRMRQNIEADRPNRPPRTDEWLTEVFPDGRACPEIVAIDKRGRILVLDLTAGPHSTATPKPGDLTKLPVDAPAGEHRVPHLDKTKAYGAQVARGRPKWYSDYTVSAQDRYWTTGEYSVEVTVQGPKSAGWDPTAGPPDGSGRRRPNFKPQPYDPDRPSRAVTPTAPGPAAPAVTPTPASTVTSSPAPAPGAAPPGGSRGGVDTPAPAMEIEGGRVKLYRGVGAAEAGEIIRYGDFQYSPHGGGKYFAFTKQDAVNAAEVLYPEGATIIETTVPRAYVPAALDEPMAVHHPHIAARGEPAVMMEGEVVVFYDPRAGGWSLHVDDGALDVMNSQMTRPKILSSPVPVVGTPSSPGGGAPGDEPSGPASEHASPTEHPRATAAGETETLAPSAVRDDFVPKLAAEHEALVLKPGRYVIIGGAVYAVMMVGSVLFFINDVIAKGPIEAGKEWGLMGILSARIAASAGGAVAGVVGLVLFMPSDQAGAADQAAAVERLDVIDAIIHDAFEDVVGPRRVLCIGDCTPGNRHIFDPERYARLHAKISALVAHAWEVEDDETARRRKRAEVVAAEHRREEEHDLAERVRTDKELAGYREAMHRPVGFYVHSSVGEDGTNDPDDVKRVAKRLHELGFLDTLTEALDAIGDAIYLYQSAVLHMAKPDSRIDPRGQTEAALRAGRKISMAL